MEGILKALRIEAKYPNYGNQISPEIFELMVHSESPEELIDPDIIYDDSDRKLIAGGLMVLNFHLQGFEKCTNQIQARAVSTNHPISERKYIVQIFKWPLNIGSTVRGAIEKFGKMTKKVPENLYHTGIVVYNTLHHYNQHGLQQHLEMPGNYGKPKGPLKLTRKSRNEFDHWLHTNSIYFTSEEYDFSKNNCISFVQAVCDFLEVEFDEPEVLDLQAWLQEKNETIQVIKQAVLENPLMEAFRYSGLKVTSPVSKKHELKSVKDELVKMFKVNDEMEAQFVISNTGGIYDKDLGTVKDSINS